MSNVSYYNIYDDDRERYFEKKYDKTVETLNKLAELIAFINTYGKLYTKYYEAFIINLNNMSEHFLQSSDSKVIDELYTLYSSLRELKNLLIQLLDEDSLYLLHIVSDSIILFPQHILMFLLM